MTKEEKPRQRNVTVNRRARRDYYIEETVEAGLVLVGSEVKSLRDGRANLTDSYGRFDREEAWLVGAHISPYDPASQFGHDPVRTRKLLLNRREINRLGGKVKERGYTLVPLRIYFKHGHAKVELGLARGKRRHDKRAAIRERDVRREMDRAARTRQ